jgi:hypothetical protein
MNTPLIGLTGHAGSGKDSCAAALAAAGWKTAAFADALRIEVAAAFHIDPRELTERATKELPRKALAVGNAENAGWLRFAAMHGHSFIEPRSPRWALQRWGEFRRTSDPHHWVRHIVGWIRHQRIQGAPGLVVTDVRFPNEALAMRGLDGHVVRVHRAGHTPPLAADTANHESERHQQISVDADIHNTGSLAELSAEVWRVVSALAAQPAASTAAATGSAA